MELIFFNSNMTALIFAAGEGYTDIVRELLKQNGIKINDKDI